MSDESLLRFLGYDLFVMESKTDGECRSAMVLEFRAGVNGWRVRGFSVGRSMPRRL